MESFLFGNNLDCVPIIGFLFVNLFTRTRQKSPDEKAFALAPSPFYLFLHFPLLIKSQWELNLIAGSILGAIACVYREHIYVTFLLLLFIHFKLCFPFHFCPTCFWFFFWQFTDVSHNFPWGWHSFFLFLRWNKQISTALLYSIWPYKFCLRNDEKRENWRVAPYPLGTHFTSAAFSICVFSSAVDGAFLVLFF